MKLELLLHDAETNKDFDISNIAEKVTVKKSVDGTAGQLSCILAKDPTNTLTISNGSAVQFRVDDTNVFYGYVFKIGTDAEENYKITCYDQLRYLKNTNVYTFRTETASQIFEKICKDFDLKYEVRTPISFVPPAYNFLNKPLYSIIQRGLDLATINDRKVYYIIDEFGTLVLSSFMNEAEQLNIHLGDNSMVTSFTYERSIDSDTYNQVKLYRENQNTGLTDTWIVNAPDTIAKWGVLQLMQKTDETMNTAQIREQAQKILDIKNKQSETLKMQCEGVLECVAGKVIRFTLARENIDRRMRIISSTHTFTKDTHTMDLEVGL